MAEPFIGQIVQFGGNFAPRTWAFCDGQLLAIAQNNALFSILGTTFGGDGRTSFALPDMRGRACVHPGTGPGLTPRQLGQRSGTETVILNITQIPSHTHAAAGTVQCNDGQGNQDLPVDNVNAGSVIDRSSGNPVDTLYSDAGANANMAANNVTVTVGNTGGSQFHNNMQPYLCVHWLIALQGIFPSRN